MLDEVRIAGRTLLRAPRFALIAVLTVALGVGANVAIFAVVQGVVLRPLPYAEPDRLVRIWSSKPERDIPFFSVSPDDFLDWRARNRVFAGIAAYEGQRGVVLTGGETPREGQAARIGAELLPLLGSAPALGRGFTADEFARGERVALVAEEFWRTELAGDPAVLGRTVILDAEPYTVVGVMPPGFTVPMSPARVWTPLVVRGGEDRSRRFLRVLGRLRDGVTVDAAAADMTSITADLAREYPPTNDGWSSNLLTLEEAIVGESFHRAAFVLLAVVGLVLVIACANVSNLLLSRVASRRRETAVQTALGATRRRIVRQWLLESAWLGVAAAPVGLLLGMWAIALLRALGPASVPRFEDIRIDATTALFTAGLSLVAALALGVAPALVATRHADTRTLAGQARGGVGQRDGERLRAGVLIAQVTLAVILLVGATLLVQSFRRIQRIDLGFQPMGLAFMQLSLPEARYDEGARPRFFTTLLERFESLPEVEGAGAASTVPFAGGNPGLLFLPEHMTTPPGDQPPDADYRIVHPTTSSRLASRS